MNPQELDGKRFAVTLIADDGEGAVFFGVARFASGALRIERDPPKAPFDVRDEWLSRIRPVTAGLESVLGDAECWLSLTVGNLPSDADVSALEQTGLKWPQS